MPKRGAEEIFQLKITLKRSKPPIWRRVQVRSDITFTQLHDVIQTAMGWADMHLHQFIVYKKRYGRADLKGPVVSDEDKSPLWKLVGLRNSLVYEYDFGDCWDHKIVVEKILSAEEGVLYPRCISGQRACPPEDIGGIWGYEKMLLAINDPSHPEHREMLDWVDEDFDPAAFDLAKVNRVLTTFAGYLR
ncbi:MAG: plasmid pRiA4b ORF-3 family protein [Chloracidobacterium sp.]|nr:plasmid pRiA4b ORF-3 family protein [Chloracidobacterium sp.]